MPALTVRELLAEATKPYVTSRPAPRLLIDAIMKLVEDVERQEARIKELENWRTS